MVDFSSVAFAREIMKLIIFMKTIGNSYKVAMVAITSPRQRRGEVMD